MIIGLNLLNFEYNNIDGVGYLVKRMCAVLQERVQSDKYLLIVPRDFCCESVLDIHNGGQFGIIKLPQFRSKLARVAYKLFVFPILLKRYNLDVLYSPAPPVSPFISKRIRVVTTINDVNPLRVDRKQGLIYKWYYKSIVKAAILRSDWLVTISKNSKKDILELFDVDPNKLSVMYGFVTGKTYSRYPDRNFFIAVGTIHPGKNLGRAIRAFAVFLNEYEDKSFKFYIIGRTGWGVENLREMPTHLGIQDNVIFTGYLDEDEIDWYYKNCAALIHTSLYEGFGLPPLEAMYYGKPSVVSNSSSLPEVVGDAGVLVDSLDHFSIAQGMKKIMNEDARRCLIKEMPRQIQKFDPEEQVKNLLDVFERVARGPTCDPVLQ